MKQAKWVAISTFDNAWYAIQRGSYPDLVMGTPEFDKLFKGRYVRFGAYGNPSHLPLPLIAYIASLARRWTGYFHDWQFMKPARARAYGKYFMASCEPHNWQQAQLLGLRTFTVTETPEQVQGSGIECLADSKGIQCASCGLCEEHPGAMLNSGNHAR